MIARRTLLAALPLLAVPAIAAPTGTPPAMIVDTHAHVFLARFARAADRRYDVAYDATPAAYLAMLAATGATRGVLVQPSFLGTDNRFLLDTVARHPDRLRAIVALAPDTAPADLRALAGRSVAGIRLNLVGRPDPDLAGPLWRRHLDRVAALGWQIEVQCEAARLPALLPGLAATGAPVVIDHYGRPDPRLGLDDPGFRFLLRQGGGRVHVKLSGAYRIGDALADRATPRLLDAFGAERLLYGSDWPHTRFEARADAVAERHAFDRRVPDPHVRATILGATPARLFGFQGASA